MPTTNQKIKSHEMQELATSFGLSSGEYGDILNILGREPNQVELGIFSVMWSEHCSYKSTRVHLKKLPTEAPWVICGPGENAGVIDIGDGQAAIFKMESHNHPSFIEPYQGAATGVGGILRDVFTMGARPIANINALRFGDINHPKTRHLLSGVVSGIGGYGNCVGVPTVGGECNFHESYNGNILVNAMTVGIADKDKIFYSKASGVGNPVVYVGSKTGRDGIHGATMASTEFDDKSEEKRPTVQVGDPFTEKLLIEACLELMQQDAIVAIQDMGAAGLTCSSLEMPGKSGLGIELHLDKVPTREEGMTPYELMLSESQERMLMILKPEKELLARRIFEKWQLDFAVIGSITDTGHMILMMNGEKVADLPIAPLSENAPVYMRPYTIPKAATFEITGVSNTPGIIDSLKVLMATPDLCSKRWIWEQYDYRVGNDTIQIPGGDAAIVRVHDSNKALAITSDSTPRYCYADPVEGGKQAVVESWRNITAVGATPLAITNCLNFGNPERPEIMGQLVGCLEGMAEACRALNYPIVSGNVSLYNETSGSAIYPTPAIGGVGIIKDIKAYATIAFKRGGEAIVVIGETTGHLGASLYLRDILMTEQGLPPKIDLTKEIAHGNFVRSLIKEKLVSSCHDISDGGLLVAVSEMAFSGDIGAKLIGPDLPSFWFGEDQARYVLTIHPTYFAAVQKKSQEINIPFTVIGETGGDEIEIENIGSVSLKELRALNERTLPEIMK